MDISKESEKYIVLALNQVFPPKCVFPRVGPQNRDDAHKIINFLAIDIAAAIP